MLSDATIVANPTTLRLTYQFYPIPNTNKYMYTIFQGDHSEIQFSHNHRKFLNIKVINGIRDVENEMKNTGKSPINKLLRQFEIDKEGLEEIAKIKITVH
ncbi:hypothetical protein [Oceanobacillus bengalensis]|uniref:Uncharacterized protein n=1 Tax=Oceanobacillus bengalensis TaxID=1435466 RepID=A0A494YXT1_9BACI|nr:hypothetical protein [Oceanobacillus bengalensis]RKQ15035.1 hypothetical protein D8M05_11290 [Oceanobacillus bengalensis]